MNKMNETMRVQLEQSVTELRKGYRVITGLENDNEMTDMEIIQYMSEAMKEDTEIVKKYYIEISEIKNQNDYIFQSKWYNTKQEAFNWAKGISYLSEDYFISLMSTQWDESNDCPTNIEYEEEIKQ